MNTYLKQFLIHFFVFNIVTWLFLFIAIRFAYLAPSEFVYADDEWDDYINIPNYNNSEYTIVLDHHSHTLYSDGYLTPKQNIQWHIAMGFNAMVITDHNTLKGIDEIREIARTEFDDKIKVLPGVEWTTDRVHLNLIFPPTLTAEEIDVFLPSGGLFPTSSYTYTPTDNEIKQVIKDTHALGGIVVLNHYPWSERFCRNQPSRETFLEWDIDYIEIINENEYDQVSVDFCEENNLGMITGTDMHYPGSVYSWTLLKTEEFTEEAIFEQLKARNTSYLYEPGGSGYDIKHRQSGSYTALYPLIKLGEAIRDIYASGDQFNMRLTVFFSYIYVPFLIVEGTNILIKRKREKRDK